MKKEKDVVVANDRNDVDDDIVAAQNKNEAAATNGNTVAMGGSNKELFIPEDISIYFNANNISTEADAGGSIVGGGPDAQTDTTRNKDNEMGRRRRRHRRDSQTASATTTTSSSCLSNCEAETVEQHLFHHHHHQNHHRGVAISQTSSNTNTSTNGNSGNSVSIVERDIIRDQNHRPILSADTSGEQILYFESSSIVDTGSNRSTNATNGAGDKHKTPLIDNDHIIIIPDDVVDVSADDDSSVAAVLAVAKADDLYVNDEAPKTLPLRPIIRGPYNDDGDADDDDPAAEVATVYTEQHAEVKLNCEVDLDISAVVWMRNGQVGG